MPDQPARPDAPELLAPSQLPRRRKGGSERGRIAMLHALAHIDFVALELAVDPVGRFCREFPRAFVADWPGVAADAGVHFGLLHLTLSALCSHFGAPPAPT